MQIFSKQQEKQQEQQHQKLYFGGISAISTECARSPPNGPLPQPHLNAPGHPLARFLPSTWKAGCTFSPALAEKIYGVSKVVF